MKQINRTFKIKYWILIFVYILLTGCNTITHSNKPLPLNTSTENITPPPIDKQILPFPQCEWSLNTRWDADFPELDYANDEKIIFHGDYGLFIYDLVNSKILNSISLEKINLQRTQNDGPTQILVSNDGNTIWFYPYQKNYMYIYSEPNNLTLTENIKYPDDYFDKLVMSKDILDPDKIKLHLCSDKSILFSDNSIGYIYYGIGGEFQTLTYCRGDSKWQLFSPKDKHAEALIRQSDNYYQTYKLRGQKNLVELTHYYEIMYNRHDYAGICALSKGLEYSDDKQKKWLEDKKTISLGNEFQINSHTICYEVWYNNGTSTAEGHYLYFKKDADGWYADGLPNNIQPSKNNSQ